MKKIIITGATGMIGIALIKLLLSKNFEVVAIVRNKSSNYKFLPNDDRLKIIECDLENIENLKIEDKNFDIMYHMAWEGTRGKDRDNVYMQNKNIKYTLDAIKLAKKINCKCFVGTGSQAEYGRVEGLISANTPIHPETAYGSAKYCAGNLSRILANQYDIKHIWCRILSIYGPNDNENSMIMTSIREMMNNNKSPEYTKAEQKWDYLYVDDLAKALYLIGEKGKNNSIYPIGNGKQEYLYKYIEEIRNQINKNIKLKLGYKEYAQNQVMNLCADIRNLTEDTGFKPEINFKEGIKRTIEWYKRKE